MPRTRLLIVDDEEPNRDMLARRLARHDYDVNVAASAEEGLAALDATPFDLLLLDIQMPGMSGIDMLRVLRRQRSPMQLPVIMVTAKSQSEDVVQALDMGANDYVTKPIDLPVTLARIRTQIARRHAEQALLESEERYALAVRGSKDGLWDWKIDTQELFCSPRFNELLGCEPAGTTATLDCWLSRVHSDDEDRVRAEIQQHLGGLTGSFESEHRVRYGAAQHRWVLARGVAVCDTAGQPVRMAGSLTDITEGKVADALTGLPNRVLFMERLGRLLDYRRRLDSFEFALLFVDLDRFKSVNDGLGHHAGDQLLIEVARRLEQGLRTSSLDARARAGEPPGHPVGANTVARMGGDEFGLLLSGIGQAADATRVAARIGELLREPLEIDGQQVCTSASMGIALSALNYSEPSDMLRDADTALYRAKGMGRGGFQVFDLAMREAVVERVKIKAELRRAVEQEQFVVHYQPIVSITTRQVTSVEALVRWRHPERGLIGPREFLPVAEETGLIIPLGEWILNEVCRQWHAWRLLNPSAPPVAVAVNASARQLAKVDFPEQAALIAERHGVPTEMIEIELTEAAMMADLQAVRMATLRLKALGFRVSIDDFGAANSSFSCLQHVPVDRLKIDSSLLVTRPLLSGSDEGILQAVIGLARHLDLEVVAEGIETPEQLEHLRRIDCGFGQGYVFLEAVGPLPLARLLESGSAAAMNHRPTAGAESPLVLTARAADGEQPTAAHARDRVTGDERGGL